MSAGAPKKRDAARERAEAIGREHPEQRAWIALLGVVREAAAEPTWEVMARAAEPCADPAAPALAGVTLTVNDRDARALVTRLIELATEEPSAAAKSLRAARKVDAAALLDAAIGHDRARLDAIADEHAADRGALAAIAELATRPLLQACQRVFQPLRSEWAHGSCGVCGAWPALAEARGLSRDRRLRCGACGGDQRSQPLLCPYCGNADHERLGALIPEGNSESRKVESCHACQGYWKVVASITPLSPELVSLEDLATIELDVAALERGFSRPAAPPRPLGARVIAAPKRSLFGWSF